MRWLARARDGLTRYQSQRRWRRALYERDIPLLMEVSKKLFPANQQPVDEKEATAMMHIARTRADWLDVEHRSYSHFWCLDHSLPSMLPPELLPRAERYRPEIRSAVGIAIRSSHPAIKPALPIIGAAMAKVVTDNVELIDSDPDLLHDKIEFARQDEFQRLFGVATSKEVVR